MSSKPQVPESVPALNSRQQDQEIMKLRQGIEELQKDITLFSKRLSQFKHHREVPFRMCIFTEGHDGDCILDE